MKCRVVKALCYHHKGHKILLRVYRYYATFIDSTPFHSTCFGVFNAYNNINLLFKWMNKRPVSHYINRILLSLFPDGFIGSWNVVWVWLKMPSSITIWYPVGFLSFFLSQYNVNSSLNSISVSYVIHVMCLCAFTHMHMDCISTFINIGHALCLL